VYIDFSVQINIAQLLDKLRLSPTQILYLLTHKKKPTKS